MAFQKGISGNPSGKRKEKLFFDAIMMEAKDAETVRGFRVIARKLLDLAVSGDIQAIKEVANRIDGQPVAAIEATIEQSFVVRTPEVVPTSDQWLKQNSPQMTTIQ